MRPELVFAFGSLGDYDQPRVGDEEAFAIALEIITDYLVVRNADVLIHDCAAKRYIL